MTIHYGDKVVSEEHIQYLKEELDDAKTVSNMISVLEALDQVFVSLEMLEKTRIGVTLTRLTRRAESGEKRERKPIVLL
ncbi:hypothetical protein BBJ29_009508 [Phytophthora kernoviae]|uniref:TFIIS N-terminal domain-containing protein n=1 Tax=Phytophthora kernoviae TaxID=325452 RepID=A0A3F2RBR5_9STRA|nr:hypothetical protein BBP00_00009739 [Phytophthora kernoviae]RLN57002.1 hypothetical protein BBJ29_009508 [Phytophthora kernoviae]